MEIHGNPIGSVHGGIIFSIADSVGGAAALSRGGKVTTVSGNINYINPALGCTKLIGEAIEVKSGRHMSVINVSISNQTGTVIAIATMTYYFIEAK